MLRSFYGRHPRARDVVIRDGGHEVRCDGGVCRSPGGGVLVVDGGGSHRVALVGEIVASLARESGWAGLLINGCVRDVAALRERDLGIKAIRLDAPALREGGGGRDRCSGDIRRRHVPPGDTLFSDDDGVVTLGPSA